MQLIGKKACEGLRIRSGLIPGEVTGAQRDPEIEAGPPGASPITWAMPITWCHLIWCHVPWYHFTWCPICHLVLYHPGALAFPTALLRSPSHPRHFLFARVKLEACVLYTGSHGLEAYFLLSRVPRLFSGSLRTLVLPAEESCW